MLQNQLLQCRLINQQLIKSKFKEPTDLVGWLGAVQAQDYAMSKWGIGLRLKNATDDTIEKAINKGSIIRTHVMRPTWHFVAAEDIRWLLELTAPHVHKTASSLYRRLELDNSVFKRTDKIIQKALEGNIHLTRKELMNRIANEGIKITSLRAVLIMFSVELKGIVCNGIKRDKQFTYALLDERVPMTKKLTREESIAKLATRYFTSHAPATLQDFVWWSGLPVADAKAGLELIKSNLISEKIGEEIYWMSTSHSIKTGLKIIHLLPCFDEFTVSYKNRSASFDLEFSKKIRSTFGGILNPIIVVNGKVIGTWKRTVKKESVNIELYPFTKTSKSLYNEIAEVAKEYGKFLSKPVKIK
jgi:hypothetical protein